MSYQPQSIYMFLLILFFQVSKACACHREIILIGNKVASEEMFPLISDPQMWGLIGEPDNALYAI